MQTTDDLINRLIAVMNSEPATAALAELEVAAQQSQDARVLLLLAGQYASRGKMDAAEAAYSAVLQTLPEMTIARFQLGLLQVHLGQACGGNGDVECVETIAGGTLFAVVRTRF
ncbi:MAG: hypothetical protein QM803_09865 [Rhodocyclaceae bacterium]